MSIFGIIGISIGITLILFLVFVLVAVATDNEDNDKFWNIVIVASIVIIMGSTLIGIGIATEDERVYIAEYEIQKLTIEQSLKSDMLTGLERVELVNKAIELNGELAKRKASFNLWHTVYYDNSIYDNVDFIVFE